MGQIKLMVSLLLIVLFSVAIITFSVNFGVDNDASINLNEDGTYSNINSSINEGIEQFYDDANTSVTAIGKTTISTQTEATEGGTAFKVGPWGLVNTFKSTLQSSYRTIFGTDSGFSIFITAFLSMIGIIMGFYIYKTLAGRNPD